MRVESLGGTTQTEQLSPSEPTFVVQSVPSAWEVAKTYFRLGIEHILSVHFQTVNHVSILLRHGCVTSQERHGRPSAT